MMALAVLKGSFGIPEVAVQALSAPMSKALGYMGHLCLEKLEHSNVVNLSPDRCRYYLAAV